MLLQYHFTPPEALAPLTSEDVELEGRTFRIERPANPERVLDHPSVHPMYAADEYRPHWVRLWPAGRMLAAAVLREPWEKDLEVLELGCGLGLAGIAALARGLRVTFTDVDETALAFAAANARLNGFTDFHTLPLDFRYPPSDLPAFPVVIGSDLIYQDRLVNPLVKLLRITLAPGGICLMTDPDRPDCKRFRSKLAETGFDLETEAVSTVEPGGEEVKGTLYRIRRKV